MQIEIKEVNPYRVNWDSLVKTLPEGTVFQTTYWARYLERTTGVKPIFLIAQGEKGRILGSLLFYQAFYFRRLLKFGFLGKVAFKIINRLIPVATWRFGPLIYDKDNFNQAFNCIIKGVMAISKKKGIVLFKDVSLPIHAAQEYIPAAHDKMSNLGFRHKQNKTILLRLQKSEKELWNGLKNSARKAINKMRDLDLMVAPLSSESIDGYYGLLVEARRRAGVQIHPTYPSREMYEEFADKKILEMYGVKKGNDLLGAITILNFNDIFFEVSPAQSDYAFKNKIYVNDMLKWHLIKRGADAGRKLYDLNGVFLSPKNAKQRSLNQFKEKWGGEEFLYPLYRRWL